MLSIFLAITLIEIAKIVLVLLVFGFLLHLAMTYIPVSPPVKQIIVVVLVLLLILWLLERFGGALGV